MKRLLKKFGKYMKPNYPSLTNADALGSNSTTSTIISSSADPMLSVPAGATTASVQAIQTAGVTTASDSALVISDLASADHLDENHNKLPSLPDVVMPAEIGSMEFDSTQHSGFGLLSNATNVLITGGTLNNIIYIPPANISAGQMKIPVPQKPNSSPLFTGWKDVLDKLGKIFIHHADRRLMSRCSCLLWGMGGIGKTQICLKFLEERCESFSHVFWVDASSHESITMSLKSISDFPAAQASGLNGSVESVLYWISYIHGEWLMVFDNADEPPPEVVAKFFPPGNRGNILITSRNRSMGRVISFENSIEINEMEKLDAITLFLKASCLDPSVEHLHVAEKIVTELGCIPLAVNQAGAYIEAGKCDIHNYLRQLSAHHQTLMSDNTFKGASNYDKTVYGTWDLSFKEIERRANGQPTAEDAQAAQAAVLILQICAFYHHSNISKEIFQSAAEESRKYNCDDEIAEKLPLAITSLDYTLLSLHNDNHWDDFIFGQGVSVLLSFSLIKRGKSSQMLAVHPLVHYWSREQMLKPEQQKMCQMGSIILSCAIPQTFTSQDYALRQLIFPHIKANELYRRHIGLMEQYYDDKYTKFALVMRENGDWKNAEKLEAQVVDMRKQVLGAEHPNTLTSIGNLAIAFKYQGRLSEAEHLEVQVMSISKRLLGAEHPGTIIRMANLAITYSDQGRLNEAEQLGVQVMDMSKRVLGAEHPDTLTSMANLATTYNIQRRFNEAEKLEVQVMDMSKRLLGAEHPNTLTSMANLARTYSDQGRLNEAEQLGVQVMEVRKRLLGAEHPLTLTSMANLTRMYNDQRRFNEAEQLGVQVMDLSNRLLGTEHPLTLTSMANLARTYSDQGRFNEEEQLRVKVMDMSKRLLGAEHPHTLTRMANLARTYNNQRRLNEAEQLEIQVMDMSKRLLGPEHPDTLTSMANLAIIYNDQGRLNEAEQLGVQVMDMSQRLLGAEHPDTLTSMANLAITYNDQGRLNKAEQLEAQVMDMSKRLLGPEHPDTLTSMANLARTYNNQRRLKEAEKLEIQVMDMSKRVLGAEHPDTLTSMANLARTYNDQGRLNEAEQLGVQVMVMSGRLLGAEHPHTIMRMANLAITYSAKGRLNEAEQLGVKVMNMSKRLLGAEHPHTLTSMENLANTYYDQGRLNEAEQLGVQVMDISKRLLGPEHPLTLTSMVNLARTYSDQGRLNEAERLNLDVMDIRRRMETD